MAPMATFEQHPLKRTASEAQFDTPPAKKQDCHRLKHHKASWDKQKEQRREGSLQDEGAAEALLGRSITLALQAVGFEAAEPETLEAFRMNVEECMVSISNRF